MKAFIGASSSTIQGEPCILNGNRCFSAYYSPSRDGIYQLDPDKLNAFYDSGAFQDVKDSDRLTPELALMRQLKRESELSKRWEKTFQSYAIASYDRLIDEKSIDGKKVKQRWQEKEAWAAVNETVAAASYLNSQRQYLDSRILVMGCQGVRASQYKICAEQVLQYCQKGDWLGLGGWCILGRPQFRYWMPAFRETLLEVIPIVASSVVQHVHIYGVMYLPACGYLQHVCDRYGLTCSTDSKRPLDDVRRSTQKGMIKSGARSFNWRENVQWWIDTLANLQQSEYYLCPSKLRIDECKHWKQMSLWDF